MADACRTGAATDIIFGLALGYKSTIIPCFVIAICIYVSFSLANMYGIACAALGMLTTMSTGAMPLDSLLCFSALIWMPVSIKYRRHRGGDKWTAPFYSCLQRKPASSEKSNLWTAPSNQCMFSR